MLLAVAALAVADESGTDREVLGALDALKQAMVAKDRPALAKLLHPDLTYGHTDGHLETRDQVLDRVTDSKVSFGAIDVSDAAVRVYGQIALVTAKLAFHVNSDGKQNVSALSTLDVWIRGPEGWQLVGRQLTRPPK
jgi:ketosteroid isomerase-like protein